VDEGISSGNAGSKAMEYLAGDLNARNWIWQITALPQEGTEEMDSLLVMVRGVED
jgi:hypothetical protein